MARPWAGAGYVRDVDVVEWWSGLLGLSSKVCFLFCVVHEAVQFHSSAQSADDGEEGGVERLVPCIVDRRPRQPHCVVPLSIAGPHDRVGRSVVDFWSRTFDSLSQSNAIDSTDSTRLTQIVICL